MGADMSAPPPVFDRAVNSKGAVSPLIRATASSTPVSMPWNAAR